MLSTADRLEIHELVGLYAHLVDDRQFSRLGELVTPDIVLDATARGVGVFRGQAEMRDSLVAWADRQKSASLSGSERSQVAHHATNVLIEPIDADNAKVVDKGIVVYNDGTVHSNIYRMTVVRTDQGWRVSSIEVLMLTPETVPEIS